MDWLTQLLLGLAAPAAGVLGAWLGGRGVVQQARITADKERALDRERDQRREDAAARTQLWERAEAYINAIAAVRSLPVASGAQDATDNIGAVAAEDDKRIYEAYARVVSMDAELAGPARALLVFAKRGALLFAPSSMKQTGDKRYYDGEGEFINAIDEFNRSIHRVATNGYRSPNSPCAVADVATALERREQGTFRGHER